MESTPPKIVSFLHAECDYDILSDMSVLSISPIGIFDSGVGGLSVLRAVRAQMPGEPILYVGDQVHIPYGPRPMGQIRDFSEAITGFLLDRGAKIIVVACNTASAAALKFLRETFPHISFVGMEPAVKPAAEHTQTGKVGVLATPATFQGALYASVVERFANGVELFQNTCSGLVQQIEQGNLDGVETRRILEEALHPMLEKNIDTVVLGCTHYPFVIPLIEEIVGKSVRVIDPAPAVARQIRKVLEEKGLERDVNGLGEIKLFTSGNVEELRSLMPRLLGYPGEIEKVIWSGDQHIEPATGSRSHRA
jgi:glutamate racemase